MVAKKDWQNTDILIDLNHIHEITQNIDVEDNGIKMGAAVPMSDLIAHKAINKEFPMLVEACRQIGSVQIQNRATIGGNIANASPAGDTLPVLAVYKATILIGPPENGDLKKMPLEELMQGPGQTVLSRNQYIAYIYLPFPPQGNQFWYFRKVGIRKAMAISKVSLAVFGIMDKGKMEEIRICAGSVSPKIDRAKKTELIISGRKLDQEIIEQASREIVDEIDPLNDIRSTSSYRKHTCQALLIEALSQFSSSI